jgi:hypothetical protein
MSIRTEGGLGEESYFGLCNLNNQLYAVGTASGQVQMNNTSLTFTAQQAFMQKMNSNYSPVWTKWGTSTNNPPLLGGISASKNRLFVYGSANMVWDQGPTIGTYNYNLLKFDTAANYMKDFSDVFGTYYHGSAFYQEGSNGEIYHMICLWGTKGGYDSEFKSLGSNTITNWTIRTGDVTCSDHSALIKNGKLHYFSGNLNAADMQNGQVISSVNITQAANIGEAYLNEYSGNQILFYGFFGNSITLGNAALTAGPKGNAFVSIVNSNVILSAKEHVKSSFSFYPNPVENSLHVNSDDLSAYSTITILSPGGAELLRQKAEPSGLIDISHLNAGIYFLKIDSPDGSRIEKMIKE